jgi:hypothetical protein
LTCQPFKALLLLGWLVAAVIASPRFNPNWSRLPAGAEIAELRTSTSRTYSNGDGTFTVDIAPMRAGGADSQDSCQPASTGSISHWYNHGYEYYSRSGPGLRYGGSTVAYAKFDLTPIPDISIVLDARLQCYQYEVNSAPVRAACTHPLLDPDSANNEEAFDSLMSSRVLAETSFSDTGWMAYDLGTQGVTILQGLLQQGRVTLGIKPVAGQASSYGSNGDERHTRLCIIYADTSESDIQVVSADPPYPLTTTADTTCLTLKNNGLKSSVPFWVYATAPELCPTSVLAAAIPVGRTVSVKLPLPVPDSPDTMVNYTLWADCANDPWVGDDTTRLPSWVFPPSTYAAEGFDASQFPPTGWVIVDNDGGNQSWQRRSDDSIVHSGAGFAMCTHEPAGSNDDWLVSGPICPKADRPDSLGFFYRVHHKNAPMHLQTWAMRGQSVTDTIRCLTTGWVSESIYCRLTASLDGFDGDTIYVGFRCQSSTDWNDLCLDDVWFSGQAMPDMNWTDIQVVRAEPRYPLTMAANAAQLVLTNKGVRPSEPFWVYATAPGLCPKSTLAAALQVGETTSVKLLLPLPDSPETLVNYTLWAACTDDHLPANDSARLACWVFPEDTYAAEGFDKPGFPPTGWVVQDNDSRSQRWERRSASGVIHSGTGFTMCPREPNVANDDWLISGPICPEREVPDSLGYFCRTYQNGSQLYMQTWAMRGQNMGDTMLRVASEWVSGAAYHRRSASLDAFDGDTIYIGFRFQSSGSSGGLCLDDIWLSGFVPPDTSDTSDTTDTTVTPKPRDAVQRTAAKLPDFAFAPNPSGSRVLTVRSALAVGKRRTLTLRNVAGRLVRAFVLDPSGMTRLDLRGLAPGVYMATLDGTLPLVSRKLVITAR